MQIDNMYPKPNGKIGAIVAQAPIENLIFEGGGPKGLVYVGANKLLEEKGILGSAKNVGGSSAGAMTALVAGLGYSADEIKKIVYKQDINDFTDVQDHQVSGIFGKLSETKKGLSNLLFGSSQQGRGLYLGDKLQQWIQRVINQRVEEAYTIARKENSSRLTLAKMLKEKGGHLTFQELKELGKKFPKLGIKDMAFTGTNYTDKTLEIFSYQTTPDMPVDLAVRISVSLPWFFKSVKYKGKEYMDGGCLDNYPMGIFDRPPYLKQDQIKLTIGEYGQNLCTLGLKVDSEEEMRKIFWEGAKEDNTGWFASLIKGVKNKVASLCVGVDYVNASKATDQGTYAKYAQRTIQIPDLGYSTYNFNLTPEDKGKLATAGYDAAKEWYKLYYDNAGIELELDNVSQLIPYLSTNELSDVKSRFPQFF
ncbi:MAG: patatin-like phospholipase family protein [Okeania sp. SIO3B5]|uniref:patatin-like phospholipase family protein n=1 Tax=Okeania sp. SIO3B5 TaxID=2607811 RepID=UPI0013FE5710|nr:patatin-like phospholipase family protein [Okeania sp. SIO3B5]NEO52220.1 patatin-like phospholipase family protein [Okeania sp. SIO3B5]